MARAAKLSKSPAAGKNRAKPSAVNAEKAPARGISLWWTAALLLGGALIAGFIIYAPSMNGDFVFDDQTLPMLYHDAATKPLRDWLGVRPLLMATYFLNFETTGLERAPYHYVNVLLHCGCAVLLFFALRRLLEWGKVGVEWRFRAALFASAVFLLHPVQTEAVSYIASRSEPLSVLFFLAAFNVFLYRPQREITFGTSAAVLVLYGCAMSCKEHTAVLPGALLLTDYFFNPGFSFSGVRRNWRLYIPTLLVGLAGLLYFRSYITSGSNLGFGIKQFTPFQYLLTQFRAIFVYLRLFLFPIGQNADYRFPISFHWLDRGAVFYGIALFVLVAAAVYYRKRYSLASYGFLLTLLLLAPTSSFLPIKDTLAERRMYLPFIGLSVIVCAVVVRIPWRRNRTAPVLTGLCILLGILAFERNKVWAGTEPFWSDVVSKDSGNARALMGLADAYAARGRCAQALPYFQKAAALEPTDYRNTYNLASAYDCVNQGADALAGYRKALALKPSAEAWAHIAILQMKSGEYDTAYASLGRAQQVDAGYLETYSYRGILDLALSKFDEAASEFQTVLSVSPSDPIAQKGLNHARRHERQM